MTFGKGVNSGRAGAQAAATVFPHNRGLGMSSIILAAIEAAAAMPAADPDSLARGAVIGALVAGAAFLVGGAVMRSSGAAWWGLLMIATAGAMQFFTLGFSGPLGAPSTLMMGGLFAAAALIFCAASLSAPRSSSLLSGAMYAGALALAGVSAMNVALGGEASHVIRFAIIASGVLCAAFAAFGAFRNDGAAQLILPGAILVLASPFVGAPIVSSAVFAVGVLAASLSALIGGGRPARRGLAVNEAIHMHAPEEPHTELCYRFEPAVSDNKLAAILDYTGVAVWDWTPRASDQTDSFAARMGAGNNGAFTPEALRDFIAESDREKLERRVFGLGGADGSFDEVLAFADGRRMRLRGARTVDDLGRLERIVMFAEDAPKPAAGAPSRVFAGAEGRDPALATAAATLTGAAAKTAKAAAHSPIVKALEAGELEAAFQPIVGLDDRATKGCETLLRWPAAESRGEAMGAEAIVAAADEAGKGGAVARLMLDAAAARISEELRKGEKTFFAAFNVSASQLMERGFVEAVREAIQRKKLPAKALVLEITEAERLRHDARTGEVLRALTDAGAALAYDDFGAGFSSLENLHRYSFDYLKIDKSFVEGIAKDPAKRKIVSALAGLGKDLGVAVIAEGVETEDAARLLGEIGCSYGQGFHLGRPKIEKKPIARIEKKADAAAEAKLTSASGADAKGAGEKFAADKPAALAEAANDMHALAAEEEAPAQKSGWLFRRRR
jgi:EAL domain-containing protein (putative c-di-GMP-specific phosphodiesterase class I)